VKLSYQFQNSDSICEFFINPNITSKDFLLQNTTTSNWTDWFGLAFLNPNNYSLTLNLTAYKEGNKIKESDILLLPYEKKAVLSTDIWPSLTVLDIDTVFVHGNGEITVPLSITGNFTQDRHLFFQGAILPPNGTIDYREEMRLFVERISEIGKRLNSSFFIIPQNGQELFTDTGEADGEPQTVYLSSIDATGREDLLYGYNGDNTPTPISVQNYFKTFLDIGEQHNVEALITDYCFENDKLDDSYLKNNQNGYISFGATSRGLDVIPTYPLTPYNENNNDITDLHGAKNFLYLINPSKYEDNKELFLNDIKNTNYDVVIIDLFFNNGAILTKEEINSLKTKKNGGKRLVICYMSIGEAENYRYYWDNSWTTNPPSWLLEENPDWEGNYKVKYWEKEWQNIILNNNTGYLTKIINAEFDGVYLDIIDAFEYFQ
jgi:cysteinyl-tRNA synthetase